MGPRYIESFEQKNIELENNLTLSLLLLEIKSLLEGDTLI